MSKDDLKKLAETFRANASNKGETTRAADAALAAHPGDDDVADLVAGLKAARDSTAVLAVIDEVAAR